MKAHVFSTFCVSLKTSMRSRTCVAGGFLRGVKKISNPLSSRNAALPLLSPLDQSLPATMTLLLRLVYSPAFIEMLFDTVNEKKTSMCPSFSFMQAFGLRGTTIVPPPKKKCNNPSQTVEKFKNEITSPSGGCQMRQIIENITIKLNGFMNSKKHVSLISFIIKIRQSVLQYSSCHKMALNGGSDLIFSGKKFLALCINSAKAQKIAL